MILSLNASEAGVAQFIKQPGVTVEAGDILGILSLDDPSRVHRAKPFEGQLPPMGLPSNVGSKSHQRFASLRDTLIHILQGYDNQSVMQSTVKELISVLRDPTLPFLEASSILSTLSGRLPAKLENTIRTILDTALARHSEFPSSKLRKNLDIFVEEHPKGQDRQNAKNAVAPLEQIIEDYKAGLKVHEWIVMAGLMKEYYATEKLFNGREEDVILHLRDENRNDLDKVVALALSHSKVVSKNALMLALLEQVMDGANPVAVETTFSDILHDLAELDSKATSKVALKAREVFIHCQLPSWDERTIQMEQILKSSIQPTFYGEAHTGPREPSFDIIKELVDSRYTVFDVLPKFFEHADHWVILAALEVYVRRAYRAYNILNVDYEEPDGDDEAAVVTWLFRLQKSGSPPQTPVTPRGWSMASEKKQRTASMSDLTYLITRGQDEPLRTGAMCAVNSLDQLERQLLNILRVFPDADAGYLTAQSSGEAIPRNVLNIALRLPKGGIEQHEEQLRTRFTEILNSFAEELKRRGLRRVTLIVCRDTQYPSYFTLRGQTDNTWSELSAIRDIEPALAFQLELNRLSNFNITPCFVENRQVHIYYAVGKENSADCRFFVRALIRPGRLRGSAPSMRTSDYLVSEIDRLVTDILNALEGVCLVSSSFTSFPS